MDEFDRCNDAYCPSRRTCASFVQTIPIGEWVNGIFPIKRGDAPRCDAHIAKPVTELRAA